MHDDLSFAEQVRRDLRDVRWPAPEEIRASARRRTRRNIAAVTVVLALAGVSAIAVTDPGDSSAPAPPAAPTSPARHEITTDALLQPGDLGQPADVQLSQSAVGEPVRLEDMLGYCRTSQGLPEGWQTSQWSRSQILLRAHPSDTLEASDALVVQDLFRLTPQAATQLFAGLEELVAPCAEWRNIGPLEVEGTTRTAEVVHRWAVVQRGFAGDDAAILRNLLLAARDMQTGQTLGDDPPPVLVAAVRVGDLVTVLRLGYDGTEAELRQLAVAAAARMCAVASPAC